MSVDDEESSSSFKWDDDNDHVNTNADVDDGSVVSYVIGYTTYLKIFDITIVIQCIESTALMTVNKNPRTRLEPDPGDFIFSIGFCIICGALRYRGYIVNGWYLPYLARYDLSAVLHSDNAYELFNDIKIKD